MTTKWLLSLQQLLLRPLVFIFYLSVLLILTLIGLGFLSLMLLLKVVDEAWALSGPRSSYED